MKRHSIKFIFATIAMAQILSTACAKETKQAPATIPARETSAAQAAPAMTDDAGTSSTDQAASVWDKLLDKYATDKSVNQLLFIKCTTGSKAEAYYYKKNAAGAWELDMQRTADIGKAGIGKTREGDKKTPEGDFSVRQAFGILDNPGTAHKYYKVTTDTYCCGDHGKYYNTIIEASKLKHKCHGEHMINYKPQYDYGFEITYNNNNVIGKGSAVFVHCKGKYGYTMGCIGLDKDMMKHIIQDSDRGIKICIHKK